MRPLQQYFVGQHSVADISQYLQAALSSGNTLYMPQIPLNDEEASALAAYILSAKKTSATALASVKE
jgi:hypothetical protein